jgi:hypothetical protein
MKRPRPHIPWSVRYLVIGRQVVAAKLDPVTDLICLSAKKAAEINIRILFGNEKVHLDHDPPLRVRSFNERTGEYDPPANSADHLTYRTVTDHRRKTNDRGEGAQFPDRVLINRARRRDKPKRKRSRPIQSRPFQKVHRPFRSM